MAWEDLFGCCAKRDRDEEPTSADAASKSEQVHLPDETEGARDETKSAVTEKKEQPAPSFLQKIGLFCGCDNDAPQNRGVPNRGPQNEDRAPAPKPAGDVKPENGNENAENGTYKAVPVAEHKTQEKEIEPPKQTIASDSPQKDCEQPVALSEPAAEPSPEPDTKDLSPQAACEPVATLDGGRITTPRDLPAKDVASEPESARKVEAASSPPKSPRKEDVAKD